MFDERYVVDGGVSISSQARQLKRRQLGLQSRLLSINNDAEFVSTLNALHPNIPVIANLRCGLWYVSPALSNYTCYFKSSDGHVNEWAFNLRRFNMQCIELVSQHQSIFIIDSTRKGKRFPDSFSRTIPIWACVINRVVFELQKKVQNSAFLTQGWDTSLHMHPSIPSSEITQVENFIDKAVKQVVGSSIDLQAVLKHVTKPLRAVWLHRQSPKWCSSSPLAREYLLLVCVSVSNAEADVQQTHRQGWHYVQGAGDDEEFWANSLTPCLFWQHRARLLAAVSDGECIQIVNDIIHTPPNSSPNTSSVFSVQSCSPIVNTLLHVGVCILASLSSITNDFWLHYDALLLCTTSNVIQPSHDVNDVNNDHRVCTLHIINSKKDRFSLLRRLRHALDFITLHSTQRILIATDEQEHLAVPACVAAAAIINAQRQNGDTVSKQSIRGAVQIVQRTLTTVYPSRRLLQQLNRYFL